MLGIVMSCLLGRGYFEEVGYFGSRVYKNNEVSQVLREIHPSTLKSAIGLRCVLASHIAYCYLPLMVLPEY